MLNVYKTGTMCSVSGNDKSGGAQSGWGNTCKNGPRVEGGQLLGEYKEN